MPMIPRRATSDLLAAARQFPVVTVTGPRQSGKTTVCRATFPHLPYVNLEANDVRRRASEDPRGLLADLPDGAVIDEVQRVPELTSYLQGLVDADPRPGRFILTGSEHLALTAATAQSLAGRSAWRTLLPLDAGELDGSPDPRHHLAGRTWNEALFLGGYPAIHSRPVEPTAWLDAYVTGYVERDVRTSLRVTDLSRFMDFVRLAATRSGTLLNLSALAGDSGISQPTAAAWLSVLEAHYVVFRLRPWHRNLGKRLTKSPKLYFWDTGLQCRLLGIRDVTDLGSHPLRGAIAETWVVAEAIKVLHHSGMRPEAWFVRDHRGEEVDLVIRTAAGRTLAVEVKASATPVGDNLRAPIRWAELLAATAPELGAVAPVVVYGGDAMGWGKGRFVSWRGWAELMADRAVGANAVR